MKANQKFLSAKNDDAVSPVIAVILMVAITVVLAATVYVWVSGFGSQSGQASKSLSLSSSNAIGSSSGDDWKNYTVTAATPGMKYSDIKFTLNGAALACDDDALVSNVNWTVFQGSSTATACDTTDGAGPDAVIAAGDRIQIVDGAAALSGKTLRILDSNANSVILTLNVG